MSKKVPELLEYLFSRHPIANGIQLDDLSVDQSTYDNDDLENPLYGEQRTHRIPGSVKSQSPNNLQHSPPGLPSPPIANLNVTQVRQKL